VCRQLGYRRGASSVTTIRPLPNRNFSYDEVGCVGTENVLDECPHLNTNDCGLTEGVDVVCQEASSCDAGCMFPLRRCELLTVKNLYPS